LRNIMAHPLLSLCDTPFDPSWWQYYSWHRVFKKRYFHNTCPTFFMWNTYYFILMTVLFMVGSIIHTFFMWNTCPTFFMRNTYYFILMTVLSWSTVLFTPVVFFVWNITPVIPSLWQWYSCTSSYIHQHLSWWERCYLMALPLVVFLSIIWYSNYLLVNFNFE